MRDRRIFTPSRNQPPQPALNGTHKLPLLPRQRHIEVLRKDRIVQIPPDQRLDIIYVCTGDIQRGFPRRWNKSQQVLDVFRRKRVVVDLFVVDGVGEVRVYPVLDCAVQRGVLFYCFCFGEGVVVWLEAEDEVLSFLEVGLEGFELFCERGIFFF